MQNIKIKNNLDECIIDIEGVIGVAEDWQFEDAGGRVATYEKLRESVAQIEALDAKRIVVNIRSMGGDVGDAILIYEALSSLSVPITTRCYGYVASAATVIAQAASEGERQISANALYLVHNSTCAAEGNAIELEAMSELLLKTDQRLAELYARRSGLDAQEFVALMAAEGGNGKWLSATEAIECGLADAIIDTKAEGEMAGIKNFWYRLGKKLGIAGVDNSQQQPHIEHSVLHQLDPSIEAQQSTQKALIELEEGQKGAQATPLKKVEDPTLRDVNPTKNQKAYSDDVRALRR